MLSPKDILRVIFRVESKPIKTKEIRDVPKVAVEAGEAARHFVGALERAKAKANTRAKETERRDGDDSFCP